MIVGTQEKYDEAFKALERIQKFDANSLDRGGELGTSLNFQDAIEPARLLVDLFKRLSVQALEDFPDGILHSILSQANSVYSIFDRIMKFTVNDANPLNTRNEIISSLKNSYAGAFSQIHPYISYSLHRAADFQRLDSDARAVVQSVNDKAKAFDEKIKISEQEVAAVLETVRTAAAEQGVSQMASYFKYEAKKHDDAANNWRITTIVLSGILIFFAILSLFIHKIPLLIPENGYDAAQLAVSKTMIFAVIAFLLFLSSRNFMNHKHNSIVNRHRQNALLTHKALVEATADSGARDAVMVQAAGCIFSPQSTGYASSKTEGDMHSPRSVIELLSKPILSEAKP